MRQNSGQFGYRSIQNVCNAVAVTISSLTVHGYNNDLKDFSIHDLFHNNYEFNRPLVCHPVLFTVCFKSLITPTPYYISRILIDTEVGRDFQNDWIYQTVKYMIQYSSQ